MTEAESFEDTVETATRLVEAGRVFSRTSVRAINLLTSIWNVRRTIEKTMPFGQKALELENIDTVLAILEDGKLSKIFKDPEAMRKEHKILEVAQDATERSIASAGSLVSAASLVFAHAVFDATLFDYCRVTALWSWRDWLEVVKERKVSIAEIEGTTKFRTLLNAVDKCLAQLEKESVLKKADMLHRIIKPGDYRSTVREYSYSQEKLESIDRARHEAVHRLQFGQGFAEIDSTIFYLLQTLFYFMGLVHFRYSLKIDPNVGIDGDSVALERGA
jgi:hypothetical protein